MSVCVVNLGLKSMRAVVFDEDGRRLAISHHPIATEMGEGRVEQRPDDWWNAGLQALDNVLADPQLARNVQLFSVTASAGCLVPMTRDGTALGNAIMISDVRAAQQAARIEASPEFAELGNSRGRVTSDLVLPKIVWVKENEPERFAAADWFATPNDFLLHRLTGEMVTDHHNASKYLYDPGTGAYPDCLLQSLGIELETLPPVVAPGGRTIPLRGELISRYGLPDDARAVVSTYDAICAVYGAGVADVGDACDVSGTVTSFRVVTDRDLGDEGGGLFVAPHAAPGHFLAGGSNNLGGGIIEWAKQLLYAGEADPYAAMTSEAADAPPGAAGITFLPYLLGERAPVWDANARAVFFGLGRNHQRPDLIRAVFEGAAFSVLDIAERLREAGVRIDRVSASGGLARLVPINQIKADMLGVPVRTTREIETTALGAALVALVSSGRYASLSEASAACVDFDDEYEPNEHRTAMYRDFFGVYRGLYASLRELFDERERLIGLHREVLRTKPAYTENL
ncbi:MAG TPA: FGGY-family carbohydrate kinase [Candidatus Limnocylindria bacterium]|jgi:xylulokinase|nr:FGGY-family carbohydrate kinase [Candidatus Limnocylindria bacterium]